MNSLPRPVLFAFVMEFLLLGGTWLFLVRPRALFGTRSEGAGAWVSFYRGIGFFLACSLFCWSVILGVLLLLNGVLVRV